MGRGDCVSCGGCEKVFVVESMLWGPVRDV